MTKWNEQCESDEEFYGFCFIFIIFTSPLLCALCSRINKYFFYSFNYKGIWTNKVPLYSKERNINFNELPYSMRTKFIGYLPNADLRRFSYTSKKNYILCFQFRGLPAYSVSVRKRELVWDFSREEIIRFYYENSLININLPYFRIRWVPFLTGLQQLSLNNRHAHLWNSRIFKVPVQKLYLKIVKPINEKQGEFLFKLLEKIQHTCKHYRLEIWIRPNAEFIVDFMSFKGPCYHIYLPTDENILNVLNNELEPVFDLNTVRKVLLGKHFNCLEAITKIID